MTAPGSARSTAAPLPLLMTAVVGGIGLAVLFAGGSPSPWLLPLGALAACAITRPDFAWLRPAHWSLSAVLVAAVVVAGAASIAWGCLVTPERSWDGFASWGLDARHLLAGDTLSSPYFADPAVLHYSRGYPLLQPVLVQQFGSWLGPDGARLWYVAAWLLLLHAVRSAVWTATASTVATRIGVLGCALVPMFLEPGGGGAESGFADLLLAALLAYSAHAVLAGSFATALCLGLLLPVCKNEGVLHLALWLGAAAAWRGTVAARGFLLGGLASLLVWLPVQHRLLHPGDATALTFATFVPLSLLVAAWVAGRLAARLGARGRWLLLLVPALAVLTLPGQLRTLLGDLHFVVDVRALPVAASALLGEAVWLRRFGATFLLLAAAAALAWRQRGTAVAWRIVSPLLLVQLVFVLAVVGFVAAVPTTARDLFVREGVGRYLAQSVGTAWIGIAIVVAGLGAAAAAKPAVAAVPKPTWFRTLVPLGSRRDRCLWIATVTLRKLREGPGPWLRAVRKGLFQLLPLGLRNRLLRWSGEEQFFRRHEPRHFDADASVERAGVVSVVLPVFDQADMLAASIDSVLAQTHAQLELIVVDDGSRDGVLDVLRRYLGDPRVRLLTQPNQGLPKALSTGFEFATGEFFTWTSADNLMLPGQLAALVAFLRSRPATAMVWGDYELIDDRGAPLVGGEFRVMDRTDQRNLAVVRTVRSSDDLNRYEDNFIGPCFLYRGRVGRLLGDYNPELGLEDYDYWMRINRLFRLEHLGTDEVLYRYRVHDNTLSARARELKILERAKVLMDYERRRAAWTGAPLSVLADEANHDWIAGFVQPPDTLSPLPPEPLAALPAGKTLVVVDGARLPSLAGQDLPQHVALAAVFRRVEHVHQAQAVLRDLPLIAFASDADVAARLAVYRREVFAEPPGAGAYGLAVRHAANATFFRATRDAAKLARVVPTPLVAAPPAVLLQVDRLGRGGLERVVLDLAAELLARGHRVGLLELERGDAAVEPGPECARLERVRLSRADDAAYAGLLRTGGWQLVDAHSSTFGAAAAAAAGVPFVQTVHNSYVWYEREAIERCRAADPHTAAYVCVSAQALGYLDLRLQLDVAKALVIENGIADVRPEPLSPAERSAGRAELGFGPDDFVFVQVASIQPAKAHRAAVHALAALRATHGEARLLCLGAAMHPVLASQVHGDVERLGLGDAVVWGGHRADVTRCYQLADAFLLPSYWEGCSLAVWEAIAVGLPMVLADVGAAAEQLRHGHGELVAPPFRSLFELDASNLGTVVDRLDADYVQRTAAAMARVGRLPRRPPSPLPVVARRATMARRKTNLFAWLLQGGPVAAARPMIARDAR